MTLLYVNQEVISRCFNFNNNQSEDLNDFLVLISLISFSYSKLREKNPLVTPLEILYKITGTIKDNSYFCKYLENLSILVELMYPGLKKIDACGMKTSQEIFNKIKELLEKWMPF